MSVTYSIKLILLDHQMYFNLYLVTLTPHLYLHVTLLDLASVLKDLRKYRYGALQRDFYLVIVNAFIESTGED